MSFHCSAERLGLAQPERERDRPARRVPQPLGGGEHALAFLDVERLGRLRPLLPRRLDQRRDVAGDPVALHRDLECPVQHAMHPQHGRGGEALVEQLLVGLLEVLGLQLVEATLADVRVEVHPDHRAIGVEGAGTHSDRGDVVGPVVEPFVDEHRLAGRARPCRRRAWPRAP